MWKCYLCSWRVGISNIFADLTHFYDIWCIVKNSNSEEFNLWSEQKKKLKFVPPIPGAKSNLGRSSTSGYWFHVSCVNVSAQLPHLLTTTPPPHIFPCGPRLPTLGKPPTPPSPQVGYYITREKTRLCITLEALCEASSCWSVTEGRSTVAST